MKKILLTFAITIQALICLSQDIKLNGGSVSLPAGHQEIKKEDAVKHAQQKFKGNKIANDIAANTNANHTYKIGDVLIMINSFEKPVEEGHFAKLKESNDHMYRGDSTYQSKLTRVDNNIILTVNSRSGGIGLYSIFANNPNRTKIFTALIEYNPADKNKVDSIAEHLINHLRFKD